MGFSGGVAEAKIVSRRAEHLLVTVVDGSTRLEAGVHETEVEAEAKRVCMLTLLPEGVAAGELAEWMSLENKLSISDPVPLMAAIMDCVPLLCS